MEQHHKPTNQEVRDWLSDQVASRQPPPEPEAIRSRLWPTEESERAKVRRELGFGLV